MTPPQKKKENKDGRKEGRGGREAGNPSTKQF